LGAGILTVMGAEIPLTGGRLTAGVVRVGDSVRRPMGLHSSFVHILLKRLEAVRFVGAPRLTSRAARC
jgi:hypothetical protein